MSAQMIARWNAIPLEPASASSTSLKRGRPENMEEDGNDDDDDDDVSLVSRSPSPKPHDAMDVDESHKFDEYIRRPAREVITVDTKIKASNKGFSLLSKPGWVEGQPVGLNADGRVDPVPFHIKSDLTGLGKTSQDVRMIEETVSQRRGLDSERQQKESEDQRKLREDSVARKTALESEIISTLRAFYCTLCDKQFKNVAQYDEHTNSYAHHHKARFKDMQANVRIKPLDEIEKRKEKERKREEKELRKIAAANGIKMPKPATIPNPIASPLPPPVGDTDTDAHGGMEVDEKPEPKISNWGSISGAPAAAPSQGSGGGFSKSGWASVGPAPSRFRRPQEPPAPAPSTSHLPVAPAPKPNHNPTFRNAGWTSLDTGSFQPPPPPPPPPPPNYQGYEPPPPPPSPGPPSSNPHVHGSGGRSTGFSSSTSTAPDTSSSAGLGSSSSRQWQSSFAPPSAPAPADPPPPPPSPSGSAVIPPPAPPQQAAPTPPEKKPARSNWQQFQKGAGRRK